MQAAEVQTEADSIWPNDLITKLCVVVEIFGILLFPEVRDFRVLMFYLG